MRRHSLGLIALLAALAVAAGCTVGPSSRPPVAVQGVEAPVRRVAPAPEPPAETLPDPGRYDPSALSWTECTAAFDEVVPGRLPTIECARLRVAANPKRPALAGSVRLDLTRVGSGPAVLVVVAEAAGPPGTVLAARLATRLPPELLDAYTLIGFARRGTGPTDPLNCIPRPARKRILSTDPAATRPDELSKLLDTTRTAIQTCVQQVGRPLVSIGSSATADDLEQLRVALGTPVLNILARGNASTAVLQFMRRYPASVGRVVLDGVPDPSLDAVGTARVRARAAQRGLDQLLADCAARGCRLGPDPRAAFHRLVRRVRHDPLATPSITITPGTVYHAVLTALGNPELESRLLAALAAARGGDGSGLAAILKPLITGVGRRPPRFDAALATRCNDAVVRLPPQRVRRLAGQWRRQFGPFGALFAQRLLLCSSWPVPPDLSHNPRLGDIPPFLVIATAGDPITPARGTRRAAQQLPAAVLINWQADAHGAVGRSRCVNQLVTRFLVDGRLPVPSTLCPP